MTHLKSYLLLAASVAGTAVLCLLCGWWVSSMAQTPNGPDPLEYGVVMALTMAPIFGGLFWAITFEPPIVPAKSTGWRRWRFLMWWAAIAALFVGVMWARWGSFQIGYLWTGLGFGLFLAGGGWAFASQRADRARTIARFKERKAFAARAKEAILEIAKSDPWLDMTDISSFLSRAYNGMAHLGDNGYVRPGDLQYINGVADATVVPQTAEKDGKDVPVMVEYVLFITLLAALSEDGWVADPVERVVAYLEQRAGELREKRLAKKI